MNILKILFVTLVFIIFLTFSCCVHEKTVNNPPKTDTVNTTQVVPQVYSFVSPVANQTISPGQKITIKLKNAFTSAKSDSITIYLDGKNIGLYTDLNTEIFLGTAGISPGIKRLKLTAFFQDGKTQSTAIPLRFLSDLKPKQYSYRVLGTFPHDINAYTQGFEYRDGYFYESTGQRGGSSLRKILPGTGDFIKFRNLSASLFGEGITVVNGNIYQVTWRDQVGFIYNAETFEQIRKFSYENFEGWGLSNNGEEIIMSDGSNILYFRDLQYFSVNRKIEVFDNISEVDSLNELEYINGIIYANRYMTNEIVMIDPATGKVIGKADMTGLLKPGDRHANIDVLNGIAWDETDKRMFVTGKNWPKIYWIEMVEK